jgi:hypothetical protein
MTTMSEAEYVRWLNEHGERERLGAIEQVVEWFERQRDEPDSTTDDDAEGESERMMELLKVVLERAKTGLERG